jgi:hypothetical protein
MTLEQKPVAPMWSVLEMSDEDFKSALETLEVPDSANQKPIFGEMYV